MPVSQLCGVLHGRSDTASSVVAHPTNPEVAITSSKNSHNTPTCRSFPILGLQGVTRSPSYTSVIFHPGKMFAMHRSFSTLWTLTFATSLP